LDAVITHIEEIAVDKEIESLWCALDEDVDRLCGLGSFINSFLVAQRMSSFCFRVEVMCFSNFEG
jgi:hypothetical protein